ncbi:MAG: hypothetical protein B6242_12520 [Anaerolineaceae bacterium 4572_78]|nr:MAG: hypothetical protein B6242_12520 [Anaerolineaceae bacterium 4572_78]
MYNKTFVSQYNLFFQQFIKEFTQMGSILPSSTPLAQAMTSHLACKEGHVHVLEAGAGTGVFTKEIIRHLQKGDSFDIIEINPKLVGYLQRRLQNESAFQADEVTIRLINGDIRTVQQKKLYDYIIFSLPLANFPPSLTEEILTQMIACLKPSGTFSYVKYIFIGRLKYAFGGNDIQTEIDAYQEIIDAFTYRYQMERQAVLTNVPPAWVYHWRNLP